MKKSIFTPIIAVILVTGLAISVFAGTMANDPDKTKTSETQTIIETDTGTETGTETETKIETESEIEKTRIRLLELALEPKDPYSAAKSYAEGVKTRNGALQYAVMSPELRSEHYSEFAGLGWVTGVSSPWVESYEIRELYRKDNDICRFEMAFTYTDSTKSYFTTREYVTARNFDGSWFISSVEKADIGGKITKLTPGKGQKPESIFVEAASAKIGYYDKANVIIGNKTKIYDGFTDNELSVSDLKEAKYVLVTFTDDPRIMIYPVSAEARIIRVFGQDIFSSLNDYGSPSSEDNPEGTGSIEYENTQYGFRLTLPGSWCGFTVVTDEWEGLPAGDSTGEPSSSGSSSGNDAAETGPVLKIRHPLWTEENPRQDIPIMILAIDQWTSLGQGKFHIGAAPIGPTELCRNNKYVFALPARYNYAFPAGYEEVEKILEQKPLKPLRITHP
jgi:hypothetical protein